MPFICFGPTDLVELRQTPLSFNRLSWLHYRIFRKRTAVIFCPAFFIFLKRTLRRLLISISYFVGHCFTDSGAVPKVYKKTTCHFWSKVNLKRSVCINGELSKFCDFNVRQIVVQGCWEKEALIVQVLLRVSVDKS